MTALTSNKPALSSFFNPTAKKEAQKAEQFISNMNPLAKKVVTQSTVNTPTKAATVSSTPKKSTLPTNTPVATPTPFVIPEIAKTKPTLYSFFNETVKAAVAPSPVAQTTVKQQSSFVIPEIAKSKPTLMSFFNEAAKKSIVTPSSQPAKTEKTGLLDKIRNASSIIPKIGESVGGVFTNALTGDSGKIQDMPKNIWENFERPIAKLAVQFPMSAANVVTHPTTPQTYEVKIPRVLQELMGTDKIQTYQSEATPIFDAVIAGERPMIDALAPFIQVPLDASIASGLLESGAKSVLKRVKVNEYETSAAIQKMGLKDLSVEAQQAQYRKLAKELHPDVGGTTKQMAELNKANDIINKAREQGTLINEPGKIAQAMRTLSEIGTSDIKKMPEILAKRNGTESYLGVKGLLPEQAGTIPVNPGAKTQPAFGLSTREINAKPIGSDVVKNLNVARKANDSAAVLDILKEANVPENIAKNVYNTIMKTRSEVEIAKIVESVSKIQESRVTLPTSDAGSSNPLIEEARKYKGAELVKTQGSPVLSNKRRAFPMPSLENKMGDGVVVEVKSFNRKQYLPLLEKYKGYDIVKAGDDISVWDKNSETLFRVGLDDSKSSGDRFIDESVNTVENAKKYIDWEESIKNKTKVDPLVEEAKKYKSAEEFVRANNIPEEHYVIRTKNIVDEYLKKNPDSYAKKLFDEQMKTGDPDRAYARALSPDSGNIFSKLPKDLQDEWALKPAFDQETGETLTLAEHDTLRGTHWHNAFADLDAKMQSDFFTDKTKSQLTDIWNEANKIAESSIGNEAEKTFAELITIPKGERISDPYIAVNTKIVVSEPALKIIGAKDPHVSFTRLSLKHLSEKGVEGERLFKLSPDIIKNPDEIRQAVGNRFLFVKSIQDIKSGRPHVINLEVTKKDGNIIVTAFQSDNRYLSNYELLWKAGAKKNLANLPSQHLRKEDGGSTLISALKEARNQKESYIDSNTEIQKMQDRTLPRRSLEESKKAFVEELQLDKYEDAAKASISEKDIPTQRVLKMEETVKTKLRELRNSKKKIARTREEIIANDQNVKDIIMMNEAEKEVRGSDLVKRFDGVKNAMINSPYFKKEGSFDDRWIESPIYKKGDTYRFATSEESKINLINRGYSYHNSIDGMAEEIEMDAEDFMEKAFDEILQGRQIGTEKAIHNYLMESSKEYAKIDSEIETLTIQINKLKQTHANIKEELSKREDLAIAEEENDIIAKARRDKERNLLREERKAEKIRNKSALSTTAKISQKTNAQNAPGDAQNEKMISNAFVKPKIILSGSDNVYIRLSKTESITKIPRDIQNNLFAIRNGEQIKKEGFIKTVHYLEKKNLKLVRNTNTGEIEVSKINMPGKRLEHIGSALPSASEMNARKTSQTAPEINKSSETIKDTPEAKKSSLPKIEDKGENIKKGILQSLRDNEKVVRMNRSMQDLIKANASVRPIIIAHNKNLAVGRAEAQKSVNDFRNEFREKGFQDLSENITLHESGKPYAGRTLVEKKFTELYRQAQDLDIDFALRENYLPHVYNETGKEMKDAVVKALRSEGVSEEEIVAYLEGAELPPEIAKSLKMSPFFTKERIFDTYAEAEKYGLTRKYDTISQLVGHYTEELEKIKANRKLVSDLLQNQQITINPKYGDIPVLLPGQEGMYFAKPKVAAYINDVFRNEESLNFMQKGIKALANVSKGMQNIVLSGGFPVSSANFFSFGYVVKSMTAGVGNLATLNIKGATTQLKTIQNFMRSNSRPKAVEWFSKKVDDGTLMRMAEQNIDMSHVMGNYKENNGFATWFKKDLNTVKNSQGIGKAKGVLKIVGKGYDKTFSEKTFNSFLPMQTITIFDDTYKNALKKGIEEKEALKLAGDTTKMFMGITDDSRGKTWNDFIGGAFFAPRFREGLVNVYWNSLAGISPNNWNKLKYAQNRKLLIGMGITFFGVYDQLNMKLNGNHIWENPAGKEMQLMVPWKNGTMIYVPFMPSQSAFFRNMVEGGFAFVKGDTDTSKQKFSTLASMPLQAINSVISNKDYLGNQIYDPDTSLFDQYKDIGAYLGLNYNHPYVNGVVSISRELNVSKQPIYPKYLEISKLLDEGNREEANKIINALSDEDRKAYEEMKKMKLKPLYQVLTKMFEIPLTFGSIGKIQSSEYFKKIENIKREIKSLPEEKRTDKIQEFIANSPESERKSLLYALMQDGIDTTGVSSSSDIIKMKPVYDKVQQLSAEGKKEEAKKIVNDLSDEDYEAYKKVITSVNSKITKIFNNKLEYDPYEAVKYLNSLPKNQGKRLLKNMSDEEYEKYKEGIPRYKEEQKSGS